MERRERICLLMSQKKNMMKSCEISAYFLSSLLFQLNIRYNEKNIMEREELYILKKSRMEVN
jgi:hypothetical protein